MSTATFCTECGETLSEGMRFCGSCGAKAPDPAPAGVDDLPPPSGAPLATGAEADLPPPSGAPLKVDVDDDPPPPTGPPLAAEEPDLPPPSGPPMEDPAPPPPTGAPVAADAPPPPTGAPVAADAPPPPTGAPVAADAPPPPTGPPVAPGAPDLPPPSGAPAAPAPPTAAPAPPPPAPTANDPHGLGAAVGRLNARRSSDAVFAIASVLLDEDEVVEIAVHGRYQAIDGCAILTDQRLMLLNAARWSPTIDSVEVTPDLTVEGLAEGKTASLLITQGRTTYSIDQIKDVTIAQELAHRLRARAAYVAAHPDGDDPEPTGDDG